MEILHATVKGTGKPLLILHGYFGMSDNWKTLGNQFAENYQVHLIDQRNHGRSFHASEFTYALLVEDLYRYIQHHQLEAVHLLGHSMGGKTAMLFAVTHPQMIAKLMIADISPRKYEPHHNAILAGLNSIDFSIQTTRSLVDAKLAELIPEVGIRQFLSFSKCKCVDYRQRRALVTRRKSERFLQRSSRFFNSLMDPIPQKKTQVCNWVFFEIVWVAV